MPKCNCTGSSCGCSVIGQTGGGISVTGTGTAADPFVLSVLATGLNIGSAIAVTSSTSIELYKAGTGSSGDPLILSGKVILKSPNNTRYTLAVSNTGVLTATTVGA